MFERLPHGGCQDFKDQRVLSVEIHDSHFIAQRKADEATEQTIIDDRPENLFGSCSGFRRRFPGGGPEMLFASGSWRPT